MGPKKAVGKPKAAKDAAGAKAAAGGKPKASPEKVVEAVKSEPEGQTSREKMGMNAEYQMSLELAMQTITNTEGLKDIETAAPLDIVRADVSTESGFQKAFDSEDCKHALMHTGQYQCGANFFWASRNQHAVKGVPIRRGGIEQMMNFYYRVADPVGFYPHIITCALDLPTEDVMSKIGKLPEVSPEEL